MVKKDCEDCDGTGSVECEGSCDYCGAGCQEDQDCEVCKGTGEVEE